MSSSAAVEVSPANENKASVRVISMTQGIGELQGKSAEDIMAFVARVSSPENQDNFNTAPRLLKYCIKNAHWSVFEQAYMTVEIETSLAIATQILRHRSFTFQQFSGRYAKMNNGMIPYRARRQDFKNRQNSIDDMDEETLAWFDDAQLEVWDLAFARYEEAISKGIAKEQARMLLPQNSRTRLHMTGNVRSWIHYINLRSGHGTQKEHAEIALLVKEEFIKCFPVIAQAMEWK